MRRAFSWQSWISIAFLRKLLFLDAHYKVPFSAKTDFQWQLKTFLYRKNLVATHFLNVKRNFIVDLFDLSIKA